MKKGRETPTLLQINFSKIMILILVEIIFLGISIPTEYAHAVESMDPYSRLEGEIFNEANSNKVIVEKSSRASAGAWSYLPSAGDWIKYSNVDFKGGALAAAVIGGAVSSDGALRNAEIWIDGLASPTGTCIATIPLPKTSGTNTSTDTRIISGTVTGIHDVYVKASGPIHIDYIIFTQLGDRGPEWEAFLSDISWQNTLDINGVDSATYISNPNGGTVQLAVTERPLGTDVTDKVTWSVDDESIATISDTGLVTAKKAGTVTVTATGKSEEGLSKTGTQTVYIAEADAKFKDNINNLVQNYETPEWFRDAKFGVFIHWGAYSVPASNTEWYPREMYTDNNVRSWHTAAFGSSFGYKDFLPSFTADKYNPADWADLFKRSGVKYIVPVAEHHDGFAMYDSQETRWNATNIGPKKDLITPLAEEIKKAGLKFGVSNHFWENNWFYGKREGSDVLNTIYYDLYNTPYPGEDKPLYGNTENKPNNIHKQNWFDRSMELVEKFDPDLIYYDWQFAPNSNAVQFLSYYYNRALESKPDGVVVNSKFNFPDNSVVLDVERGQLSGIREYPWQTDTSISDASWGYIENDTYKETVDLLGALVDIVSKNGNFLLNVGPDRRGEIPESARKVFLEIGKWLDTNGEGIYSTRPWTEFGEGPTTVSEGNFSDNIKFNEKDFRYVIDKEGKVLYATGLKWPKGSSITLSKLCSASVNLDTLTEISLLGSNEAISYTQDKDGLKISLPSQNPNNSEYPYVLKMTFDGKVPEYTAPPKNPYKRIEAQEFDEKSSEIRIQDNNKGFSKAKNIGYIKNGSWSKYSKVDFGDSAPETVTFRGATQSEVTCDIWIDGTTAENGGTKIASVKVPNSGSWDKPVCGTANVTESVTGTHDVYIVYGGGISADYFIFGSSLYKAPPRDGFSRIEGEEFDNASDKVIYQIKDSSSYSNGACADWCTSGEWAQYSSIDFGQNSPESFTVCASTNSNDVNIELWIDSMDSDKGGRKISTVNLSNTGGFENPQPVTVSLEEEITGVHDVYIKLNDITLDYIEFYPYTEYEFNRNIIWAGDDKAIENHQGSNGKIELADFGDLQNYNDDTIGWFFPKDTISIGKLNRINALDNQGGGWAGYINVKVNVDKTDDYTLNILCFGGNGRKYEVTANDVSCGITDGVSSSLSYSTVNALNVLQKQVSLRAGENIIKIQAPSGQPAPNFVALAVVDDQLTSKPTGYEIVSYCKTGTVLNKVAVKAKEADTAVLYIAAYDDKGVLLFAKMIDAKYEGEKTYYDVNYDYAGAHKVNAMLWNKEMNPLDINKSVYTALDLQ